MADLTPRPLPLTTAHLPGIGGRVKDSPEDFRVEEIPAYRPLGAGEHLYLFIEKRDLSTQDAARLIATALEANERDVGYAGQKDRHAVTRQWMSVHTKRDTIEIADPRIKIIESGRHGNKLRIGHSRGNRFVVVLRDTAPNPAQAAQRILDELSRMGLANFYGEQRFGRDRDNAVLGAALLGIGDHPQLGRAKRDRFLRRMALSALQSELFNRVLTARLADGLFDRVIAGDVLRKRASGGVFFTTDPATDQPRVDSLELDITGPLPGNRERPAATATAREREDAVLADADIPREAFDRGGEECEGTRRPFRVPVESPTVREVDPNAVEIAFSLPAGSYATRVLAEVVKAPVELPADG